MRLVFLGTGGGRHMMSSQVRRTGGIFFDLDDINFILDPGPGSLANARSIKINPEKYQGVLLSHLHVDHSTDVNPIIDGMKDPFVIAEQHCILPKSGESKPEFNYYPCISVYHQQKAKVLKPAKHGDVFKVRNLEVKAFKSTHYDPTIGFVIRHPKVTIGYPADGEYYMGQESFYEGCDILILNVLVPKGLKPEEAKHMSIDGAIKLIKSMNKKPKVIILQHFSFWMLQNNIYKQVKILQDATKIPVVQAEDFMEFNLETMKTKMLTKD